MDPVSAFQVHSDLIRFQGFDEQKLNKKNTAEIFLSFFLLQLTYFQATREAFSPQKTTSSTSKK
jgi:hypothetical protein